MKHLDPKRLWLMSKLFTLIPHSRGHGLKAALLRWAGAEVGEACEIMSTAKFIGNYSLIIGDRCFIGHDALIFGALGSRIQIEDDASLGSRVTLVTGTHRYSADGDRIAKEGLHADVRICAGASVSTGSTVLPGVTVNRMAHVAAGAVVAQDVPAYHRVGGVPARVIRDLRDTDVAVPKNVARMQAKKSREQVGLERH